MLLRGRVVGETASGLPGPGLEGVWVSVHVFHGAVQLTRLPPARAETKTGPQGAFAISLNGAGEYVIAVRAEPDGPVLTARRIVTSSANRPADLMLTVPLDDALRGDLGDMGRATRGESNESRPWAAP